MHSYLEALSEYLVANLQLDGFTRLESAVAYINTVVGVLNVDEPLSTSGGDGQEAEKECKHD